MPSPNQITHDIVTHKIQDDFLDKNVIDKEASNDVQIEDKEERNDNNVQN